MENTTTNKSLKSIYRRTYKTIDPIFIEVLNGNEYIQAPIAIDILNSLEVPWSFTVDELKIIDGKILTAFAKVYYKDTNQPQEDDIKIDKKSGIRRKPIHQNPYVYAVGRLTIEGVGSRSHAGTNEITSSNSDTAIKGAITNAFKKSAAFFGIGSQLYPGSLLNEMRKGNEPYKRHELDVVRFIMARDRAKIAVLPDGKTDWAAIQQFLIDHNSNLVINTALLSDKSPVGDVYFTKILRTLSEVIEEYADLAWPPLFDAL